MSYREFAGWKERYLQQPWGPEADDRRHVEIQLGLINVMRSNGAELNGVKHEHFTHSTLKQRIIAIDRQFEDVPEGGMTEAEFREEQSREVEAGRQTLENFSLRSGIAIT